MRCAGVSYKRPVSVWGTRTAPLWGCWSWPRATTPHSSIIRFGPVRCWMSLSGPVGCLWREWRTIMLQINRGLYDRSASVSGDPATAACKGNVFFRKWILCSDSSAPKVQAVGYVSFWCALTLLHLDWIIMSTYRNTERRLEGLKKMSWVKESTFQTKYKH